MKMFKLTYRLNISFKVFLIESFSYYERLLLLKKKN
jgi:hypothetical protein